MSAGRKIAALVILAGGAYWLLQLRKQQAGQTQDTGGFFLPVPDWASSAFGFIKTGFEDLTGGGMRSSDWIKGQLKEDEALRLDVYEGGSRDEAIFSTSMLLTL
ncbi:hypothetical protein SAMN02745857_03881 [Andreprevotia lacus DSM 23236]|jgi:hypothetical protein|uniref:Uncharacterized protein n=1 Tax=Andreprevotia lacus DSM 23236 TaxID=1121001 RepID=A0A1W1Y051_9NEIS|nr:hypothetical protein [Andreprevotia lacus]SMC29512.1 hypothetical protein SAMN02745857_03881 [Andreprevotia lacus DSM 23236]